MVLHFRQLDEQGREEMHPKIQKNLIHRPYSWILIMVMTTLLLVGTGHYIEHESFEWQKLEQAQKNASADGKNTMVFVEAEWCGICRQMERNVFPDPAIQRLVHEKYHPVTIDLDSRETVMFNGQEMTEREFARNMNVSATPTILFINSRGEVLAHQIGYNPADRFEALLEFIYSDQFGEISFEEYFEKKGDG